MFQTEKIAETALAWHMEINEQGLDKAQFEQVFKTHFKALHSYAYTFLQDEMQAEEIVQQVFFKIWEKKDSLNFSHSFKAYLYQSVYNESLNYLKHAKVKKKHQLYVLSGQPHEESSTKKLAAKELEAKIAAALSQLPEQCRTIFQLSRFEELKYSEIAERLNLSVKTIENQMGKALKIMRANLAEYLTAIIILLFTIINFFN